MEKQQYTYTTYKREIQASRYTYWPYNSTSWKVAWVRTQTVWLAALTPPKAAVQKAHSILITRMKWSLNTTNRCIWIERWKYTSIRTHHIVQSHRRSPVSALDRSSSPPWLQIAHTTVQERESAGIPEFAPQMCYIVLIGLFDGLLLLTVRLPGRPFQGMQCATRTRHCVWYCLRKQQNIHLMCHCPDYSSFRYGCVGYGVRVRDWNYVWQLRCRAGQSKGCDAQALCNAAYNVACYNTAR